MIQTSVNVCNNVCESRNVESAGLKSHPKMKSTCCCRVNSDSSFTIIIKAFLQIWQRTILVTSTLNYHFFKINTTIL